MAEFVLWVRTPLAPGVAFAYLADLTNVARWDPGVTRAEQVVGARPGIDAVYAITLEGLRRPLRYVTNEYEPPTRVVIQARRRILTALDAITVEPDRAGALVTYDARLMLHGPLEVFDAFLARAFRGRRSRRGGPRRRPRRRACERRGRRTGGRYSRPRVPARR